MRAGTGGARQPPGPRARPTRELAVQVADVLEPLGTSTGRRVVVVYGGADIERQIKKLHKGVDVVIATPGRLIDLTERRAVSLAKVEVVVLDEADRMADMGFLPQVEWVLRKIEGRHQTCSSRPPSTATSTGWSSATCTDPVRHEVASVTATVESMEHRFLQVHQMDKVKVVASICRGATKALRLRAYEARCGPTRRTAWAGNGSRPPPSTATCASRAVRRRSRISPPAAARARRHRRGGPGPRHR